MPMMKKEFRDRWYQACTDGSYYRARGKLATRDEKRRCCLGVAHAIAIEMGLFKPAVPSMYRGVWASARPPYFIIGSSFLNDIELAAIGLSDQYDFAHANDQNEPGPGEYYPTKVLDMIRNHPVAE